VAWALLGGFGGERLLCRTLTPESAQAICGRWADLVISCGSATAPVNTLWARANQSKSVILMNPAPLPLGRFDLIIAPRHDRLPKRANVVQTLGALAAARPEAAWRQAGDRLQQHPKFRPADAPAMSHRHPVVAVFLGGDAASYEVRESFVEDVVSQVDRVCEAVDGWWLATTSRRTSPAVERLLEERLARSPRCRLLLIASRDPINGTMEGMLGCADAAVVTGESISMVSEACASGRRVVVVEPPAPGGAAQGSKHARFLRDVAQEDGVRVTGASGAGDALRQALAGPPPSMPAGLAGHISDALTRLIS